MAPDGADARTAVDVVVTNRNYAEYLGAAIDSALAQTHAPTRVIVVDDGSTDASPAIIRAYGDRIEAVFKGNGGQASAMNAGMARVRGEVVIFLDADDVLEPDAAERVAGAFAADPGLVRAHYRLRVIDAAGRLTGELKPPSRLPLASGDLVHATLRTPFDAPWLPTSGNAFSSDAVRRLLPIPEDDYRLCADWFLVHTSSLLGRVAAIDHPLGRYRMHGANSHSRDGDALDVAHIAATVGYAATTRRHLARVADQLGLEADARRMASMCDVANRAVLLRVATPHPGDSRCHLLRLGALASVGRRDVGLLMKAAFILWLAATLAVPASLARRLGALFVLPDRRRALNPLLGALHRS